MVLQKINKILYTTTLCSILHLSYSHAANIETNMARMQAMDKITGRVSEIDIPVNGSATFGSFSIVIRKCYTHTPEETPENIAFVDVVDNYDNDSKINIFKGWMHSSSPALNAVEHPIYDVWLLKCYNGNTSKYAILSPDELTSRDKIASSQIIKEIDVVEEAQETTPETEDLEIIEAEENTEEKQNTQVISVVVDNTIPQTEGEPHSLIQIKTEEIESGEEVIPEAIADENAELDENGFEE